VTRDGVCLPRLMFVIYVPGDAARGRSGDSMVAGVMTRYATDERAANAAFGVDGGGGREAGGNRDYEGGTEKAHKILPEELRSSER
jgi:hypothetical protein